MRLNLLISCLIFFVVGNAVAEDIANIFQIEIIFFEHTDPKRFAAEEWPKHVGKLDAKQAIDLSKLPRGVPDSLDTMQILDALDEVDNEPINKVIPETVTLVEPNKRLLNNEALLIKNSKDMRFVQHVAWNQPLAWNVKSTPIYIRGGKDQAEVRCVVSVKPAKGAYQLNLDMIYTVSATEKANKTGINEFRLKQDVKLKKNEITYIDHPLMGLVIVVSPVVEEY